MDVGIDNIDENVMAIGVTLLEVRLRLLIGWQQSMDVDVFRASPEVVVVWSSNISRLLDMRAQVYIVLSLDLLLDILQLGPNRLVVLGLCIFPRMLDPVCTVGSVVVLSECCNWCGVGLDLFNLRSDIGLVVWVEIGRCVGSGLQVGFAYAWRVVVELVERCGTPEQEGDDEIPRG